MKKCRIYLCLLLALLLLMSCVTACAESKTYTSSMMGHNALINVAVTVEDGKITAIDYSDNFETRGVGQLAMNRLSAQIMESQSVGYDIISGATVSSAVFLSCVKDCLAQAGLDVDAWSKSVEVYQTEDVEYNADVVVIGGGGAGLAAAMSAAENGASVVVLEKLDFVGGSTTVGGGLWNCADPVRTALYEMNDNTAATVESYINATYEDPIVAGWRDQLEKEFAEYKKSGATTLFDTATLHKLQTYTGGHNVGNPAMIEVLCNNSLDTLHWMEGLGDTINMELSTATGALYQRTHTAPYLGTTHIETLTAALEKTGKVQIYTGVTAKELIKDETGRVVGVIGEKDGCKVVANASKGLVLATGGYGANVEYRQAVNTGVWSEVELNSEIRYAGLPAAAQGDGLFMAEAVGASLINLSDIQLHPAGNPNSEPNGVGLGTASRNRIFVNSDGERFVNEGAARDELCKAIFEQENSTYWIVLNHVRYPLTDPTTADNRTFLNYIEMGSVIEAETLEELAEKTGMDYEKLQASIDQYNAIVRGEIEDEYGFLANNAADVELTEGPWYAGRKVPRVHHTMGGIEINTETQVLNTEGNVIPGLYAAGECTGGIHGANRLGGNAVADIMVYGRIAGRNAAAGM